MNQIPAFEFSFLSLKRDFPSFPGFIWQWHLVLFLGHSSHFSVWLTKCSVYWFIERPKQQLRNWPRVEIDCFQHHCCTCWEAAQWQSVAWIHEYDQMCSLLSPSPSNLHVLGLWEETGAVTQADRTSGSWRSTCLCFAASLVQIWKLTLDQLWSCSPAQIPYCRRSIWATSEHFIQKCCLFTLFSSHVYTPLLM